MNIIFKIEKSLIPVENERKNKIKIFLIAFILSSLIILPFVIYNKGILILWGDYNLQQIPFYQLAHDAVRHGDFGISWTTDLGSNFIGSYSFYLLGSPFFWLTVPFPNSFLPYLMAPLLILKFAVAALTSYIFIRKFTKSPQTAFIGALLYAFSGFSIYNIFYNHFHEVIAFFPLLLIGLEEILADKKKGIFAFAVALNLINSFYFFVTESVFLFIYFIFRCFTKKFKISKKTIFLLILEYFIGILIGFILFLPSAFMTIKNPRVKNMLLGYDMVFHTNIQKYALIFYSLFFPPDMPCFNNCFPLAGAKWESVAAYMPIFSMTGIIAFLKGAKNSWLKKLITTLLIFMFIPFLNSAFNGFNFTYYARWFFALTLIFALTTAIAIEKFPEKFKSALKINFFILISFSLLGIIPKKENEKIIFFDLIEKKYMFWINILIALVGMFLIFIFIKEKIKTPQNIYKNGILIFCCFIVSYAIIEISYGALFYKFSDSKENIVDNGIKYSLNLNDDTFYRIDVFDENSPENIGMFLKTPCVRSFNSTITHTIMQFYKNLGIDRNVKTKIPFTTYDNLREFLAIKYILIHIDKNLKNYEKSLPKNYEFFKKQGNFNIYINKNFLNMGFLMDSYIEQQEFEKLDNKIKDKLILKCLILSKEQIEKYKDILKPIDKEETKPLEKEDINNQIEILKQNCSEKFKVNSYGFTSEINLSKDGLVVFSVPFEAGYSASVNGEKTDIENVDCGMMAVRCKKGKNKIEFSYKTPWLFEGTLVSISGIFILIIYLFVLSKFKKKSNFSNLNETSISFF